MLLRFDGTDDVDSLVSWFKIMTMQFCLLTCGVSFAQFLRIVTRSPTFSKINVAMNSLDKYGILNIRYSYLILPTASWATMRSAHFLKNS